MTEAPVYRLSPSVEYWAIGSCAVLALVSVGFAVVAARREGGPVPLYLLLGGGLAVWFDPFAEVLGHGVFPQSRVPIFEALGRPVPLYLGLIYLFYWPPAFIAIRWAIRRGISARTYLRACVALCVACCAGELVPLALGWWEYYGFQPMRVGGFPVWWALANANAVVGTGVVLQLILAVVPPAGRFLVVPLAPVALLAVHSAGSMPAAIALNSTTDEGLIWLGACGSMAVSATLLWLYRRVLLWLSAEGAGERRPAVAGVAPVG